MNWLAVHRDGFRILELLDAARRQRAIDHVL